MQHFSNQIPKIKSENSLHAYMLNKYECGLVSCALLLFGVDKGLWMTVGSSAQIQVNHSEDQCACMSEMSQEYESVHAFRVMTRALRLRGFKPQH